MADEEEKENEEEDGDDSSEEDDGIPDDVCLILDNGSGLVKAGLSSQTTPKVIFPECLGKPRGPHKAAHPKENYFGDDIVPNLDHFTLRTPMENGIIQNFEDMEKLWEYTFFEALDANPMQHPLILTEPPYNPKPNRERMVEIMFESFGVPQLNISIQGVLALLGHGRTSGVVLSSGEGVTSTIPVFDGYGMPHCINRMDGAGKDINVLLAKCLAQSDQVLAKSSDMHHVQQMKENHCYISVDPTSENAEKVEYEMPDGRKIQLQDERWQAPEALFTPAIGGFDSEALGVANMVWDTVSKCEVDTRRTLLSNIVLSGGSTMFPGFKERLQKEIVAVAPSKVHGQIKVVKPKNPLLSVWTGGQIFASLRAMQEDQWISIEDFDEYGASYIHEKVAIRYQ